MKLDRFAETAQVRFDNDLESFTLLISYYLNNIDRVKTLGKKVVAKGPLSPVEVIYAAEALAFDITTHCTLKAIFSGNSNITRHAVNTGVSSEINPWNLSMLGSAIGDNEDNIPIDLLSTAYNGIDEQLIKGFQLLAHVNSTPLHFWEVPMYDIESEDWALDYLKKELEQYFEWMEDHIGTRVTKESLQRAVHHGNLLRNDMVKLNAYLATPKVPIAALEYYLVQMMMGDYAQDPAELHNLFVQLFKEIDLRVDHGKSISGISDSPVRIYIIGNETQELYMYNLIENYGGVVVGCNFRLPLYYSLIDEKALSIESLAHWIWHMPTNLNIQERIKFELEHVKKQNADAVIISSVVGCRHSPGIERLIRDSIKKELCLPVIELETTALGDNLERLDYQIRGLLQTMNY